MAQHVEAKLIELNVGFLIVPSVNSILPMWEGFGYRRLSDAEHRQLEVCAYDCVCVCVCVCMCGNVSTSSNIKCMFRLPNHPLHVYRITLLGLTRRVALLLLSTW